MEWLTTIFANAAIRDIGYAVLLTVVIVAIIFGYLLPRWTHEKILAAAIKRGDEWKETAIAARDLAAAQSKQLDKFAEASKTPSEFFGTVLRDGGGQRRVPQEEAHREG